jgi:phage gp29-like protein
MGSGSTSGAQLAVVPELEARAPANAEQAMGTQEIGELRLLDQFSRIGGPLTPLFISQIVAEADSGRPARLVDLLHESRQKSGHLHGVMTAFEMAISELEFEIAPPKDATRLEKKAAETCREALALASPAEMIAHESGEATWFGYAFTEVIWKRERGQLWPERFNPIACRRFAFRQSDGALLFDPVGRGNVDGAEAVDLVEGFPVGKIIRHTPRINGDVRVREGLARCLCWMAMFANWTVRDWAQLAEMAWKPKGFGKYKAGASEHDRAALRLILQRALANGYAIFNGDTTEIDLQWPQQSSSGKVSPHKELVTYFGQEISKAVLGNPTSIEPGDNGARSSDEIRDRVTMRIREATARSLADALQRYYVAPFYALNYGTRARVGKLRFVTDENVDLQPFALGVKALRDAGHANIPESWVNDQTGIPERSGDEPVLGAGETDEASNEGASQEPEDSEDDSEDGAAEEPTSAP